jgi:hypothetical protein
LFWSSISICSYITCRATGNIIIVCIILLAMFRYESRIRKILYWVVASIPGLITATPTERTFSPNALRCFEHFINFDVYVFHKQFGCFVDTLTTDTAHR